MSGQGDLFEAYARHSDPWTSHAAADSLTDEMLSKLQKMVIDSLALAPDGLTVPEIAMRNGLPRDTVSPRMPVLVKHNRVFDSGAKRIPPGHTRQCIIWKIR